MARAGRVIAARAELDAKARVVEAIASARPWLDGLVALWGAERAGDLVLWVTVDRGARFVGARSRRDVVRFHRAIGKQIARVTGGVPVVVELVGEGTFVRDRDEPDAALASVG